MERICAANGYAKPEWMIGISILGGDWALFDALSGQSITKCAHWGCAAFFYTGPIRLDIAESASCGWITTDHALSYAAVNVAKHSSIAFEHA